MRRTGPAAVIHRFVRRVFPGFLVPPYDFVIELFRKCREETIFIHAAGISFYIILYAVPLTMLVISIAGFLLTSLGTGELKAIFERLGTLIPADQFQGLLTKLQSVAQQELSQVVSNRTVWGIFGLVIMWFLASKIFVVVQQSVHVSFGTTYRRNAFDDYVMSFGFVLFIAVLFFVGSFVEPALRVAASLAGSDGIVHDLFMRVRSLVVLASSFGTWVAFLFILYYFVPRRLISARHAFWGAFWASLLWIAIRQVSGLYLAWMASFSKVYGAYGILVLLLFWIYFTSFTIVFGAAIAGLLHRRRHDERKRHLVRRLLRRWRRHGAVDARSG